MPRRLWSIVRRPRFGAVLISAVVLAPTLPDSALFAQSDPASSTRYVASSRGTVYYPIACRAWHELSRANLRFFRTEEEATARGYRRTRNRECDPPAPLSSLAPPAAVLGLLGVPVERRSYAGTCVVARIVDGDTLDCEGGVRIRLLLIDAPETRQGSASLRATLALEQMLPVGDSAFVELDVRERDRYGRVLAHLRKPDGRWVNLQMVRTGYAVVLVYPPNLRYVDVFSEAEDRARTEALGLWADGPDVCLPRDFRAGRCL